MLLWLLEPPIIPEPIVKAVEGGQFGGWALLLASAIVLAFLALVGTAAAIVVWFLKTFITSSLKAQALTAEHLQASVDGALASMAMLADKCATAMAVMGDRAGSIKEMLAAMAARVNDLHERAGVTDNRLEEIERRLGVIEATARDLAKLVGQLQSALAEKGLPLKGGLP